MPGERVQPVGVGNEVDDRPLRLGRTERRRRQPGEEIEELGDLPVVSRGELEPEAADRVSAGEMQPSPPGDALVDEAQLLLESSRDLRELSAVRSPAR